MSFTADELYGLLPAIYRIRDAEGAEGAMPGSLRALVEVIAGQIAVVEEDIAQLYDDEFIETCADWVAPYIGDLIGYRSLYGVTDRVGSPRAEVANTIGYRRRKGTASMLEQLARDVTGWDARAVEYFALLATTQYLNHLRPSNRAWVDMRDHTALARIGSGFDTAAHTLDVRTIALGRGRYDIPNVGIHAWRIGDFRIVDSPAAKLAPGNAADGRYFFSPLGSNAPLFNHPVREDSVTHIAERSNVPEPITRRELWDSIGAFYPDSISIRLGGAGGPQVPAALVSACDLSDSGAGWAYASSTLALVDPVLGRLALPAKLSIGGHDVATADPLVSYSYGFPASIGGGPYGRLATFDPALAPVVPVTPPASIGAAIASLSGGASGGSGAVEIAGNGRASETIAINAAGGVRLEVRSADGARTALELGGELVVTLADDAEVTLNGLLVFGAAIRVAAASGRGTLRIRHCTLVPGIRLNVDGTPAQPGTPSLVVESPTVTVVIEQSILGAIRAHEDAAVSIAGSIVDAGEPTAVAYAALDAASPGGPLEATGATVIGKVHARILTLVSNSILYARLAAADTWAAPVLAERRQDGCVRFSYVPPGSRTPRRHACVPASDDDAARVKPQFTSGRYGEPAYCQLSGRTPIEIRAGADDESEMGAYHDLYDPQRATNLRVRMEEYLRFGLEAGVIYES